MADPLVDPGLAVSITLTGSWVMLPGTMPFMYVELAAMLAVRSAPNAAFACACARVAMVEAEVPSGT